MRPSIVRAPRRAGHPGNHERHAARGVGGLAARLTALDTAINVAIPEFDGRIIPVPLSFKDRSEEAPGLYAPHQRTGRPHCRHGGPPRPSASASSRGHARRLRADQLVVEGVAGRQRRRPRCACQPADAAPRDAPRWLCDRRAAGDERRIDGGAAGARQLRRGHIRSIRRPAQRFSRSRYAAEFAALPAASRKRMEEWWGTPADRGDTLRSPDRRIDKKIASKAASRRAAVDEGAMERRPRLPVRGAWPSATRSSRFSRRAATA